MVDVLDSKSGEPRDMAMTANADGYKIFAL